jgi:two-component system cell cycle sensor histidine kinase/response regulator CckA
VSNSGKSETPARDAESRLRQSEQLNRRIVEAMPGGLVHVRSDGAVVLANAKALEILGLSYDELRQRYIADFETQTLRDDGSPCPVEEYPVARALATGQAQDPVTIGVRRPDGETVWAVFTAVPVQDDHGATSGAIVTFLDITERKRSEEALAKSEAELRALVESAPNIIFTTDLETRIVSINRTVPGLTREAVIGVPIYEFVPPAERAAVRGHIRRVLSERVALSYEVGPTEYAPQHWTVSVGPIQRAGVIDGLIFILADVTELGVAKTEQAKLEARLRQAQRMEAVGRLAGGVAHDFNNMLTIVLGHADLLLARGGPPSAWSAAMQDIRDAAERAARLTRQLLALGRKQVLSARLLDLNEVVRGLQNLLDRLLGADIELVLETAIGLGVVSADPTQLEQVIVNLAANARDAMRGGGTLAIETANVTLAQDDKARPPELAAGDYVRLRARDTGVGMDDATRERIFEPFFTTKDQGKGTGLGMATVHGIVEQTGGHIEVSSAPRAGTTVDVYLPRVNGVAQAGDSDAPAASSRAHHGTIMVVEDEPLVRELVRGVLAAAGHSVRLADSAEQALREIEQSGAVPDVLLSDVVMPGMSGPQLVQQLRRSHPQLKVVLMSGYAETKAGAAPSADANTHFIQKPFKPEALLALISEALGN